MTQRQPSADSSYGFDWPHTLVERFYWNTGCELQHNDHWCLYTFEPPVQLTYLEELQPRDVERKQLNRRKATTCEEHFSPYLRLVTHNTAKWPQWEPDWQHWKETCLKKRNLSPLFNFFRFSQTSHMPLLHFRCLQEKKGLVVYSGIRFWAVELTHTDWKKACTSPLIYVRMSKWAPPQLLRKRVHKF